LFRGEEGGIPALKCRHWTEASSERLYPLMALMTQIFWDAP